MFLFRNRGCLRIALAILALLVLDCVANADHDKGDHHKKVKNVKKHQPKSDEHSKTSHPHKKAEIDFSNSEFADSDVSDDVQDEDQAEQVVDKEQADYDDEEVENSEFNDTEDNEVTDLSEGENSESDIEDLSFEDESSTTYDDYDVDEDSAADEDDDDSDANFTESDDEQVMSDISHINDYSDEIEDDEDASSEELEDDSSSSEDSGADEALEEAESESQEDDVATEDDANAADADVNEDANDADGVLADEQDLGEVDDSDSVEASQSDDAGNADVASLAEQEVQSAGNASSSDGVEDAASLPGKRRDEVESEVEDVQTTPQTMLEGASSDDQAEEAASSNNDADAKDPKAQENTAPVEESAQSDADSADTSSAKESSAPADTTSVSDNTSEAESKTTTPEDEGVEDESQADVSEEEEGGDLEDEDSADVDATATDAEAAAEGEVDAGNEEAVDSNDDATEMDEESDFVGTEDEVDADSQAEDDVETDEEASDESAADESSDDGGLENDYAADADVDETAGDEDSTSQDDGVESEDAEETDDMSDGVDDAGVEEANDIETDDAALEGAGESEMEADADLSPEDTTSGGSDTDAVAEARSGDDQTDDTEEVETDNPEEFFDNEEDVGEDEEVPMAECEPQEADVRSFRGMISGDTRGLFSGLKRLGSKAARFAKALFRKRKRRPMLKKLAAPIKNKLLLTGRRPPMTLKPSMSNWNSKLLSWSWKQFVKLRGASSPAHAAFLVDASVRKHMPIMQRLSFNLAKILPVQSSFFTIASFGKGYNQVSSFQRFANDQQLQAAMSRLRADNTRSRRTGEAMEQAARVFAASKARSPGQKQVLFIFTRGRSYGCIYKLQSAAKTLKRLGVKVYVIGFGTRLILEELTMMTKPSMIFRATEYAHLVSPLGVKPPILMRLGNRLVRWLDGFGGVWYHSMWNWYKYVKGLKYGGCGKANVGFLIDTSNPVSRKFLQKLVFNYIRLFQLQGTRVTIYAYGPTQTRVCDWRSFDSPAAIQGVINSIPVVRGGYRKTGLAMAELLKQFETQRRRNSLPNILFVISTGATSDGEVMQAIGDRFRAKKIKVLAYGINPKAKKFVDELKKIATTPSLVVYGGKKSFVTPDRFKAILEIIKQDTGEGSAITINVGNKETLSVLKIWDWPKRYKGIQYGVVSSANIAILVEGFFPKNLGYIRRFIYNIVRVFSLSGTYVTLMDYGDAQYRVAQWVQLRNGAEVRQLVRKLPKSNRPARKTGLALQAALNAFSTAPPGNQNILILITKGKSTDDVVTPAANLRKRGIKTLAVGLTGFNPKLNLGDKGFKQREISLIPFSSGEIFASKIDGLLKTTTSITESLQKIVGKTSPTSGSSGRVEVSPIDITYNWHWKTPKNKLISYGLETVNIVAVIDGSNTKYFNIVQRFAYNILRLFGVDSNIAFVLFGGSVDLRFATWKNYMGLGPLKTACSSLSYRGIPGRKVAPAVNAATKLFATAPKAGKKVTIVFLTDRPQDTPAEITASTTGLKKAGTNIQAVGIFPAVKPIDLKPFAEPGYVDKWQNLPKVVTKVRITLVKGITVAPIKDTGTQPKPSPTPIIDPPMPPPTDPSIGPQGSKDIEKIRSIWDWDKITKGIVYQSLKPAELIFVVDTTDDTNFDVTRKFIYNIIRLFKIGQVRLTLVAFGRRPRIIFRSRPLPRIRQIQNIMKRLKPAKDKKTNVGLALRFVQQAIIRRIKPQTPRVVVVITQGSSDDNVLSPSRKLKGNGVFVVSVGIGDTPREDIKTIATTGDSAMQSPFSKLPAIVLRIQYVLTIPVNGPPPDKQVNPDNSGIGGKEVKDQTSKTSIPNEGCGKPDPGKPGGPSTPDSGEGGRGGATGDKPDSSGGTDTGAGGGASGTNIKPVGPTKPVVKPKPPTKPSGGDGGPGTTGGKEGEKPNVVGPETTKPTTPGKPGQPGGGGGGGGGGTPPGKTPGGGKEPEVVPENNKPPEKVKPGEKEPGVGEKEKEKGGDKISGNTGTNSAGGIINPNTENNGENTGRVDPVVIGGDGDTDDPITGGIQVIKIPTELLAKLPTQWNWEKAINNFAYNSIAPARVVFVVDGNAPNNFELIKHYIFNIGRMFNDRGTSYTIVQFGKTPTQIILQDKKIICPVELRLAIQKMRPDPGSPNIGPALAFAQKLLSTNRKGRSVLFMLNQSPLTGNVNGLFGSIRNLKVSGVKVFSIGIGSNINMGQVQGLAANDRNSFSMCAPSQLPGTLMGLQFWLLRNVGPGNKIGKYLMKQGNVGQKGKPRPRPSPGKGRILKVQIIGSGCNDPPANGKDCGRSLGSIKVNGIERSISRRGLNIVVYNLATGLFERTVNFDTYGNRALTRQMVKFIDQIRPNRLVMVASKDAWTQSMDARAYSALNSIGAEEPFVKALRSSFALLGFKGKTKVTWTAQQSLKPGKGPSTINAQIMTRKVQETPLKPANEFAVTRCENKMLSVRCPVGLRIGITYAMFGRQNRDTCKSRSMRSINCKSLKSMRIVTRKCEGRRTCLIAANTRTFGDPCRGTYKYLEVKYVCRGTKPPTMPSKPPLKIDINSMGCNDPPAKGRCGDAVGSIKVNGKELSANKRGINVVVVRYPSGKVIRRRKNFDTFGDPRASARLANLIKRLPSNSIIAISTMDSYDARLANDAILALKSIGGKGNLKMGLRGSMAMIGFKGVGTFTWKKQITRRIGKGPSVISESISLPFKVVMPRVIGMANPLARPKLPAMRPPKLIRPPPMPRPMLKPLPFRPLKARPFPGLSGNVARGKPTKQSSTNFGGLSSRAVDGNANSAWKAKSFALTKFQVSPWWRVNIGKPGTVRVIKLTTMGRCSRLNKKTPCPAMLRSVQIRVGNVDNNPVANPLCTTRGALPFGRTVTLRCNAPRSGRFVYVLLRGKQKVALALAEFQVFTQKRAGRPAIRLPPRLTGNIARGKPTKQSSTGAGGLSARAVDGNKNSQWNGKSCTHTNRDKKPWWRVDLGAQKRVYKVSLTNRGDCCGKRLRQIEIKVGNADGNPNANALCAFHPAAVGQGKTKMIRCITPKTGRFVYVALRVQEWLTLCEVEVFAARGQLRRKAAPAKRDRVMEPIFLEEDEDDSDEYDDAELKSSSCDVVD